MVRRKWYVPLDVNFFSDDKIMQVRGGVDGNDAALLFVFMLTESKRLDQSGVLTWPQLDAFNPLAVDRVAALVQILVHNGLVRHVGRSRNARSRSVLIAGWERWNDNHEVSAERRSKESERKREQRRSATSTATQRHVPPMSTPEAIEYIESLGSNGTSAVQEQSRERQEHEDSKADPEARVRVENIIRSTARRLTGDNDTDVNGSGTEGGTP